MVLKTLSFVKSTPTSLGPPKLEGRRTTEPLLGNLYIGLPVSRIQSRSLGSTTTLCTAIRWSWLPHPTGFSGSVKSMAPPEQGGVFISSDGYAFSELEETSSPTVKMPGVPLLTLAGSRPPGKLEKRRPVLEAPMPVGHCPK